MKSPSTPSAGPAQPQQAASELHDIREAVEQLQALLRQRRPGRGPAQDVRQAIDLILDHREIHASVRPTPWKRATISLFARASLQ